MLNEKNPDVPGLLPAPFLKHWAELAQELRWSIARRIPRRLQGLISPDDILQDVWMEVASQLSGFHEFRPGGMHHWIERIALGKTVDAVRRQLRIKREGCSDRHPRRKTGIPLADLFGLVPEDHRTPSSLNARSESISCLRSVLDTLGEPESTLIRLHFLDGVTDEDIARSMNLSLGAVRGAIYRTKLRLRSLLGSSSKFYSDVG